MSGGRASANGTDNATRRQSPDHRTSGDGDSPSSPNNGGGEPAPVSSVSITPATATVVIGKTTPLAATVKDAAGNVLAGRSIAWTTSAAAIATVDAKRSRDRRRRRLGEHRRRQ